MKTLNKYIGFAVIIILSFNINTAFAQSKSINVMSPLEVNINTRGGHIDRQVMDGEVKFLRSAGWNVSATGGYTFDGGAIGGLEVGFEGDYIHGFVNANYGQFKYRDVKNQGPEIQFGVGVSLFKFRKVNYVDAYGQVKKDKYQGGFKVDLDVFGLYRYFDTKDTKEDGYFVKSNSFGFGARVTAFQQVGKIKSGNYVYPVRIGLRGSITGVDPKENKSTIDFSPRLELVFQVACF